MNKYVLEVYIQCYFIDGGTQSKTCRDQVETANISEYIIYLDAVEIPRVKFQNAFLSYCQT